MLPLAAAGAHSSSSGSDSSEDEGRIARGAQFAVGSMLEVAQLDGSFARATVDDYDPSNDVC